LCSLVFDDDCFSTSKFHDPVRRKSGLVSVPYGEPTPASGV
jgi:hypothetical protein